MQKQVVLTTIFFNNTGVLNRKFYFQPDDEISKNTLRAITIPKTDVEIVGAPGQWGGPARALTATELKGIFITLVDKDGNELIQNLPASACFIRPVKGMGKIPCRFFSNVDMHKSYITSMLDPSILLKYLNINFWVNYK